MLGVMKKKLVNSFTYRNVESLVLRKGKGSCYKMHRNSIINVDIRIILYKLVMQLKISNRLIYKIIY